MNFFAALWYSFLNGFILLWELFISQWYWIVGAVLFVLVYLEEGKEINDEFVDDLRDIV